MSYLKIKWLFFLSSIALTIFIFFYFLIFTSTGSKILSNQIIALSLNYDDFKYENSDGNLADGITFNHVEITNIERLPKGSVLKVQKLYLNFTSFQIDSLHVEIENVRLILPDTEPIVINGVFKDKKIDMNIFSVGTSLTEILSYLPDLKQLIPLRGNVDNIDLFVTGDYLEPFIKGSFIADKFLYKGFLLTEVPFNIDLQLKDMQKDIKLYGQINVQKGWLRTNKVLIDLEPGYLKFSGSWNNPAISLKGTSKVERVKIFIDLKGAVDAPVLKLRSEPSYSQQKLMVMLATGKSWQSVENILDTGVNSTALTKDFIDYFFFAGKFNQFAQRFGVSEFALKYDDNSRGLTAKKEISDKIEVGYDVERIMEGEHNANITQKIEGEYKFNNKLSVGVEREIKYQQVDSVIDEQATESNDKVLLKYKKNF